MGQSHSYFNVWAVSTTVYAREEELVGILDAFENSFRQQNISNASNNEKNISSTINYTISENNFLELLQNQRLHETDIEIMMDLFHLIDTRGFREIDLRDALISFLLVVVRSAHQCLELSLSLWEREGTQIVDKLELVHIFKLLNITTHYFGDRNLSIDQLQDLADSVYTSIGRIDGTIYYPHYVEYISSHPIVEMFMSPQFQGTAKEKLLTDSQIEEMIKL
jgi:hypothetical protein